MTATSRPRTLSRRGAFTVFTVGAIAIAAVGGPTWLESSAPSILGPVTVALSGHNCLRIVTATSLLWAAAAIASLLAGPWARRATGLFAAAAAGLVVTGVAGLVRNPEAAAVTALSERTGTTQVGAVELTVWPTVAMVVGALAALAALAVMIAPAPPVARSRYDTADRMRTDGDERRVSNMDQWDAVGRGEDPTRDDPDSSPPPARR